MSKLIWLGVALVTAGIVSGILEDTFYGGRVDAKDVLQESFFLPLAFILIFLGGALIVVAAVLSLMKKMRGMSSKTQYALQAEPPPSRCPPKKTDLPK